MLDFSTRARTTRVLFFAVTSVTEIAQQIEFQGRIDVSQTMFILLLRLQAKTTVCFEKNDGSLYKKRRVVLVERTGC